MPDIFELTLILMVLAWLLGYLVGTARLQDAVDRAQIRGIQVALNQVDGWRRE